MPGMNKASRTIKLIEASLHRIENDSNASPLDALGVLDELRRLERKWREQVAAGSPRRIDADFRTMSGWYRRWLLTAREMEKRPGAEAHGLAVRLSEEIDRVTKELR